MELSIGRLFVCTQFLAFVLLFTIFPETCNPKSLPLQHCLPSSCGNLHNIKHPFRLKTDPIGCGDKNYELSCETNSYTVIYLSIDSRLRKNNIESRLRKNKYKYYVEAINYNNYTIRLVDPNYVHYKDNCSTIPLNPPVDESYMIQFEKYILFEPVSIHWYGPEFENFQQLTETVIFLTCEKPVRNSSLHKYVDSGACINNSAFSQSKSQFYSYFIVDEDLTFSDLEESCQIYQIEISSNKYNMLSSPRDIHNELVHGFELSWLRSFLAKEESICYVDKNFSKVHCLSYCETIFPPTIAACGFQGMILIYLRVLASSILSYLSSLLYINM